MQASSLQLELKITQFRLNSVYQFTQHFRIVKQLLSRQDTIFEHNSSERNNHNHWQNGITPVWLQKG
jgi:hypothetical protein